MPVVGQVYPSCGGPPFQEAQMKSDEPTRRSLVAALGSSRAFIVGSGVASGQGRLTRFQPARHAKDAWLDAVSGKHRTFIDASTVNGGGSALLYCEHPL